MDPRTSAFHSFASYRLQSGSPPATVINELMQQGLDHGSAYALVSGLCGGGQRRISPQQAAKSEARATGVGNMIVGGIICLIGVGVTVWSFNSARAGGRYVIAWGAVVFGAIQCIKGLCQVISGNAEPH